MDVSEFTARERDVLDGIARGLSTGQIATELGVGFETVKTYLNRIRVRLGLAGHAGRAGRARLVAEARRVLGREEGA